MTRFADEMKTHLAAWKRQTMPDLPHGIYRSNGREYPHILPVDSFKLNILETIRDEFWSYFDATAADYALHTDFHHLNSSQAFAFNLLYFWMKSPEKQATLLGALGLGEKTISSWRFEHMPDQAERTTVDFFAQMSDGSELLVEVKLTESHFGGAMPNEARLGKRIETYMPRLEGKIAAEQLEEDRFFMRYQLLRNLSHLNVDRGDHLVLIVPRSNSFTWLEAEEFIESLSDNCRGQVRLVAVEDLLNRLKQAAMDEAAVRHSSLMSAKYLPPRGTHAS